MIINGDKIRVTAVAHYRRCELHHVYVLRFVISYGTKIQVFQSGSGIQCLFPLFQTVSINGECECGCAKQFLITHFNLMIKP